MELKDHLFDFFVPKFCPYQPKLPNELKAPVARPGSTFDGTDETALEASGNTFGKTLVPSGNNEDQRLPPC